MDKVALSFLSSSSFKDITFNLSNSDVSLLIDNDYFPILLAEIQKAETKIFGMIYCWHVSTRQRNNKPAQILRAILKAKKRGVDCFFLFNFDSEKSKIHRSNSEVFQLLKYSGISVRWAPGNRLAHTKMIVVDNKVSFIGSHNLTTRSLSSSRELSFALYDERVSDRLCLRFWDVWKDAKE